MTKVLDDCDAVARIRQLLAEMGDAEAGLEAFLPAVSLDAPEREQRCWAAVASTFVGALELAGEGGLAIAQTNAAGQIDVMMVRDQARCLSAP